MGPQGDAAAVVEAAAVDDVVAAATCADWNTTGWNEKKIVFYIR